MAEITTTPTLTGEQSDLLNQVLERLSTMIGEGTGVGPAGLIGAAEGGLTEALSGLSPEFMADYFRENIAPSMTRTFEEDVIPQLREEMIATGDFFGTPRVDVIEDARQKQAERMQAQMADWMRWGREQGTAALPYVPSIAGVGQGLEMERLGATQPFINTPTELAIGEPSGSGSILAALENIAGRSVSSGGGAGSPGGGGRSTAGGFSATPSSSTAPLASRSDYWKDRGGGDGIPSPSLPPTVAGDIPVGPTPVWGGTGGDRPDDTSIPGAGPAGGPDYRGFSGFLHEQFADPSTWGGVSAEDFQNLMPERRYIMGNPIGTGFAT